MKIIYTPSAQEALSNFADNQKKLLEKLIIEKKLVFGDEEVEITASDIKDIGDQIGVYRPVRIPYRSSLLVSRFYIAIGLLCIVGSFLYPYIKNILYQNQPQGIIFMAGLMTALVGFVFNVYISYRKKYYIQYKRLNISNNLSSDDIDHRLNPKK